MTTIKDTLDMLVDIEKKTNCQLSVSISKLEAKDPFWSKKWTPLDDQISFLKECEKILTTKEQIRAPLIFKIVMKLKELEGRD